MEFAEVVKNRYSCKKYDGKQIRQNSWTLFYRRAALRRLLKTCRASVFTLCSPRKGWLRLTS